LVGARYPGEVFETSVDTCLGSIGVAVRYPLFFLHGDMPSGKSGPCSAQGFALKDEVDQNQTKLRTPGLGSMIEEAKRRVHDVINVGMHRH
jgi:hypothetical protein